MKKLEEIGLVFLVITNEYWCKSSELAAAKREASRNGRFAKGERRKYRGFLVHQDTTLSAMGDIEFPNELAAETAVDLGYV